MEGEQKSTEQYYVGSVLLSDHIESLVKKGLLIVSDPQSDDPHYKDIGDTFDERCLDRAKYNVRLGKAYYKDGKFDYLNDTTNRCLTVEPYELVFVESYEVFKMPENVVGVYDLRVRSCLGGLGLQTGLQVDPTYYGRTFSPLFNFSDCKVTLEYKEQLGSIAFYYTTPPTRKTKKYGGKNELFTLTQPQGLLSPPHSGLEKLLEDVKDTREELQKGLEGFDKMLAHSRTQIESINSVFLAVVSIILAIVATTLVPQAIKGLLPWIYAEWAGIIIIGSFVLTILGLCVAVLLSALRGKANRRETVKKES